MERTQRVYQNTMAVAMATAMAKNTSTARTPSIRSPTILAKPVMCTRTPSASYFVRSASSWPESRA